MMSGDKGLNPHELAHEGVKDLGTRPLVAEKRDGSAAVCE